ncbi:MAG: hypothetical protein ACFE9Z_17110 [Promethearchaeota archaeon]
MDPNKILRIIAGSLCLIVAILRIVFFFFDLNGAIVYSAIIINTHQAVNIIEGLILVIIAVVMTIVETIIAVIIFIVLGILQIVLRKFKTATIICNVFITISLMFAMRAIAIYASVNEFSIILTALLTLYIIIFSLCIASYSKFTKKD